MSTVENQVYTGRESTHTHYAVSANEIGLYIYIIIIESGSFRGMHNIIRYLLLRNKNTNVLIAGGAICIYFVVYKSVVY